MNPDAMRGLLIGFDETTSTRVTQRLEDMTQQVRQLETVMSSYDMHDLFLNPDFAVDQTGATRLVQTVQDITDKAVKMGAAVQTIALEVVAFTVKIASNLDQLYFAAQRTGGKVEGIESINYAASQVGASAPAAQGSLANFTRFLQHSPDAEGYLQRLGVQTRDAQQLPLSPENVFIRLANRLSQMPVDSANQHAQATGINEDTILAMRNGLGQYSTRYNEMAKAIGYNAEHSAHQANQFMTAIRDLTTQYGMAQNKIGGELAGGLAVEVERFRRGIIDHWPQIEKILDRLTKGILWLAHNIRILVMHAIDGISSLIDWWEKLDDGTQKMLAGAGALLVAWRLLNVAFMTTPLGMILALAAGLLVLVQDFQAWQEGSESLIDWGRWEPQINYAKKGLKEIGESFIPVADNAGELLKAVGDLVVKLGEMAGIDLSKISLRSISDGIIDSIKTANALLAALIHSLTLLVKGDFDGAFKSLKDIVLDDKLLGFAPSEKLGKFVTDKLLDQINNIELPSWLPLPSVESMQEIYHRIGETMTPYNNGMMFGAGRWNTGPAVNQKTYITVNGSSSPQETAFSIADRQVDVNARLTHQMQRGIS
ncbi:lytic transglycosylase domain-containing protein [Serratia sp. PL7]|uniref:lytic transglycosylase domain-containing protein n=1 Tax=Serratia sp. PL7 TaxID=2952201 RepID=UPI0019EC9B46|nr:lytic transglycosylase domain-containing protein [Serratia sp. PL7]MBE0151503.1 lytic transglycosylase domain-containing protein [Serratia fonticola]